MPWQLQPESVVESEIERHGKSEIKSLLNNVMSWIEGGEQDDLALARAVIDRGFSEEFAWWLVKEARMREVRT